MAVRLRLRRMGKKKQAFYRIVAIDSRAARDGKYLENLGTYNPRNEPAIITLKAERALYWLGTGAKPTDTVRSILSRRGVLLQWHLRKRGFEETKISDEMQKWEASQTDRQKRQEALREDKRIARKKKKEAEKAAAAA
ncbi:MAG: 30S ribosomal protein S16 [candidate division KSB1 bacterium]